MMPFTHELPESSRRSADGIGVARRSTGVHSFGNFTNCERLPVKNGAINQVLVVEDESNLRVILCAHLRAAGFDVIEAADGEQACQVALSRQPEVILLDVGLPRMDGITATRALKADPRTADIPIIMLTARSSPQDVVSGLEAGAQEYLAKPFDMAELLARVQTVHRLAQARKQLDYLNSRLEAEVEIKTSRLQLLYDFMRDLHQTDSRERVYDLVVQAVQKLTKAERISLMLLDGDHENLVCRRAIGIDPSVIGDIRVRKRDGVAGQVFQSGRTLAAKAVGVPASGRPAYQGDAFLSTPLISTSLQTPDGIIGVLNVTDKPGDETFTAEEIECIRSIADAGALALDNILRREGLRESVTVLLRTVGHLAEYRDEETTLHLERVAILARILATELSRRGRYREYVTPDFVEMIVQAAPMHDIGKVGVPDDILTKPGKLTPEEFEVMKTHTEIGRRVLSQALDPDNPVPLLDMCIDIAYCHHERYDGNGYPNGLAGEDIPLAARIITLVDAYDAITSVRRYSPAKPHDEGLRIIREDSGSHFDPVIVEAFLRCHEKFREVRDRFADEPQPVKAKN